MNYLHWSCLRRSRCDVPIVCVTDSADIPAMPSETNGVIGEVVDEPIMLSTVRSALKTDERRCESVKTADKIRKLYSELTLREQEVISMVSEGLMNKQIAWELGITKITVKVHRGNATRKMGGRSLPELVRMLDLVEPPKGFSPFERVIAMQAA
jgi:FixJ family two-component response regulator